MKGITRLLGLVLAMLIALSSVPASANPGAAQISRFDGDWAGTIFMPDGREMAVRITIRSGSAAQYFRNSDGSWREVNPDKINFTENRNSAVLLWMNSGGAWSETQMFSLSFKNSHKLEVIYTPHVNNIKEGGDNESWNVTGSGTLRKISS